MSSRRWVGEAAASRTKATRHLAASSSTALLFVVAVTVLSALVTSTESATTGGRTAQPSRPATGTAAKGRPTARVMHPAFATAGQKPGLEVWRVENFEPVLVAAKDHGKFHTGDSYVVLFTKETKGKFSWDVHFWLGSQTSQDESGAAAILTVELDDQLGGSPVQYREVQEHESQLFLSHFKGGVRYLPGGVQTGFTHVDPNAFEKRMFQVKGKRNVRVRQVEPSISSMNKGDCFILDMKRNVYVYVGTKAKRAERLKAITAANQIRDQDHAGRSKIHIIDEFSSEDEKKEFFSALGSGSDADIPDESTAGDDQAYENKDEGVALFRVSDASGSTKYEKINEKPLKQKALDPNDCFYLDTASAGIYVWIGKKCSDREKRDAMTKAQDYLKSQNYPAWTSVQRIIQGGEPAAFKQYFQGWQDRGEVHSRIMRRAVDMDNDDEQRLVRALLKGGGRAPAFMPDNGDGTVEIFRVENFELAAVNSDIFGMFFGGDSYVIKYTYNAGAGDKTIIYFWQGNESSQDEKASSALHAMRLDNEMGGRAMQIRVAQDFEPKHFLKIFKGKMITLMGGKASGFRNLRDHDTYDVDGTRLFRIRGTEPDNIRASQQPEVAASLNSDDVFVLETPNATYIWNGTGSSEDERAMAKVVATRVSPDSAPIEINEASEPSEFWDALGGRGEYEHEYADSVIEESRLFHCHINKRGLMKVEELSSFTQQDLDEDDVMVLDSGDEIYIWLGNESSAEEKRKVLSMAKVYLKRTHPDERSHDHDIIITIKQGEEPESFKELFPTWDNDMWQSQQSYDAMKQQIMDANNEISDDE